MTLASTRTRTCLFAGAALAINTIDALAVRAAAGTPRAAWVGAGAVIDLVGVVTLLYWGLLVRPGLRGRASMAVVAGLSGVRAALLLPTPPAVRLALVGLLEAGVVTALGWAVWRTRARVRGAGPGAETADIVDTLRHAASAVIPVPALADVVATELAVLAYALGLTPREPAPAGAVFSMTRRSGFDGLVGVLIAAGLAEIGFVHLLLARWHPAAAWAATAAGVYGLLYLRGLTRAIAERPVRVDDRRLVVRHGLTFQLDAPATAVVSIEPAGRGVAADVTLPLRRTPAWRLTFDAPYEARGHFGRRRPVRTIAITVDDDAAFGRAVAAVIARRTARTSS